MSSVLVVSSHLADEHPKRSDRYEVFPVECDGTFGYADGLIEAWSTQNTLVLVEHDMEFSDELVSELASCPEPLCAFPYLIWSRHNGWHYAQAVGANRRLELGDEWADHSSIGFAKITPEARAKPLMRLWWWMVENAVHHALGGSVIEDDPHHIYNGEPDPTLVRDIRPPTAGRWHIHWPHIEHHHPYPEPYPAA